HLADTKAPACVRLPESLFDYFMSPASAGAPFGRYQNACSIIAITGTFEDYLAGPAGYYTRRKIRRAVREGYRFAEFDPDQHLDGIYAVNTSMDERQGRPMDDSYRTRPAPAAHAGEAGCPRHREPWFGVFKDEQLVAYTHVLQVGDMCLFNRILGHGDHLEGGVMFQLVAGTIEALVATAGLRYAMYERHTSGTPGLRYFKERMGFRPYWVDWQRADEPVISTRDAYDRWVAERQRPRPRPSLPRRLARRGKRMLRSLASTA
ncbi:MAG: hypothetical protein ACHQZR_09520, partial [Candidatus Limnocylindrales bacterium]